MSPRAALSKCDVAKKYKGYPDTRAALQTAQALGWRVIPNGHGVRMLCPLHDRNGCARSIAGTPRSDGFETQRIEYLVLGCTHC